jgi:hypothetical protein
MLEILNPPFLIELQVALHIVLDAIALDQQIPADPEISHKRVHEELGFHFLEHFWQELAHVLFEERLARFVQLFLREIRQLLGFGNQVVDFGGVAGNL